MNIIPACLPLEVSIPSGKVLNTNNIVKVAKIEIDDRPLEIELYVLNIRNFNAKNHATIHCFGKEVVFLKLGGEEFRLPVTKSRPLHLVVSELQARRILQLRSRVGFLMSAIDNEGDKELTVGEVRVVRKFSKVFPYNLPGMPPEREVEFTIDLTLGHTYF